MNIKTKDFLQNLPYDEFSRLYSRYAHPDMSIAFHNKYGFYLDLKTARYIYMDRAMNEILSEEFQDDK